MARARGLTMVLATALLATATPLAGGLAAASPASMPRECANERNDALARGVDVSGIPTTGTLVVGGRSVTVTGPQAQWRQRDVLDPTWTTRFHGMSWVVVAALEGLPAVDMVLARHAALPDPALASGLAELQETGWTEGAVRLRQATVNCLYLLTHDERLLPVADDLAQANLDPQRYWGLPENRVHNHGILANVVLLESARVFGRSEWRDQALRRLDADSAHVFSACGMSTEQSTHYHLVNVRLWSRVLRDLPADAAAPLAQAVADRIGMASLALGRLARPDGVVEAIGDGHPLALPAGIAAASAGQDPRLWCRTRGWAAHRSSWDDTLVHYTLRFGPRPRFHGHLDQGSVTWFASGVPVFSERGLFDTLRDDRYAEGRSAAYHSVFEAVGVVSRSPMPGRRQSTASVDEYVLEWRQGDLSTRRTVTVALDAPALRVQDEGTSAEYRPWAQHWQLAPGWTPLPRTSVADPAAVHDAGAYLYGSCKSRGFDRGRAIPVEAFPARGVAVPAWSLRCESAGDRVTIKTLWVVSDVAGRPRWDPVADSYEIVAPTPPAA